MTSAAAPGLEGPATVDVCAQVMQAVERVSSACASLSGYDAILCQADRRDDLSLVVRLRKQDPEAPIVLVSGKAGHPDFRELACRMGATAVLPSASTPGEVAQAVLRSAEAGRAARRMRSSAEDARRRAEEVRKLAVEQHALARKALRLLRGRRVSG